MHVFEPAPVRTFVHNNRKTCKLGRNDHRSVVRMAMKEKLREWKVLVARIAKESPKLAEPILSFLRSIEEKGALDTKTKQLISVALSVASHCELCIAYHTKRALEAGATVEELIESCIVATEMAGTPAMASSRLVLQAVEEFKEQ